MRPEILFPLFAPVQTLSGIGPRLSVFLSKMCGPNIIDLCWHLPIGFIDRRYSPDVANVLPGSIATMTLKILGHQPPKTRKLPYKVICGDDTDEMELVFFHSRADYLANMLPVGDTRIVSGKVDIFKGKVQMTHPDRIGLLEEASVIQTIEPVYRLTAGLTSKPLLKAINGALLKTGVLPEWQDLNWLKRQKFPAWRDALLKAHAPENESDVGNNSSARRRLIYDELLADQLALAIVRSLNRKKSGRIIKSDNGLLKKIMGKLPFELTTGQKGALNEILSDMAEPYRMLRLLQGDVGSGKTVVAFLAMIRTVECQMQAALMAPTEVLVLQHYKTLKPLGEYIGVNIEILTGKDSKAHRKNVLEGLINGDISIIIGTHALLQDDVHYKDLGLAVIDEQHRFGVHQRLMLNEKGKKADMLVMTATPIPRTLMLCAYSDLDSSRLAGKPAGRKAVETRAVSTTRLEEIIDRLKHSLDEGARAFWVCPLVEESEIMDLEAATDRHKFLDKRFEGRVGLLHGKMKPAEKEKVMKSFMEGELNILVATTVIEVGVDIPDANIMIVEHAERFGLAQLHQLRGRVGRGKKSSACILMYSNPLSEKARARIKILRETDDGFRIAEEDLKLRGAGELLGTRQSGLPVFRMADIVSHQDLMMAARDDAKLIIERDPYLNSKRGEALRILLYLFQKDNVVQTLRSG